MISLIAVSRNLVLTWVTGIPSLEQGSVLTDEDKEACELLNGTAFRVANSTAGIDSCMVWVLCRWLPMSDFETLALLR